MRLIPRIDPASASVMENNLSTRFSRVSKRFSVGLKSLMKGAILGISVALLNKLLNPLTEMEEKFRRLMGQAEDVSDLADKFGTDSGNIRRLQTVAGSLGLEPDKLAEMMDKFREAMNEATKPLAIGEERSAAAKAVANFAGEKDIASAFFSFVQELKGMGSGRNAVEQNVFGDRLFGAQKRFADADFKKQFAELSLPGTQQLTAENQKLSGLSMLSNTLKARNESADISNFANQANRQMVIEMEKTKAKQLSLETAQLKSFVDLQKASQNLEQVKNLLVETNNGVAKGVSLFTEWASSIKKMFNFSPIKKKETD